MYRVFNNTEKKELRVITPDPLPVNNNANIVNNDVESELDDWVDEPSRYKSSEIRIPYKRVWIAHDPEYSKDGYEILAEIACYDDLCSYVFIGPTVTFFWTPQPIEIYHSYVGNSGVPYGFAATKDYVYSFFSFSYEGEWRIIAVSRKRVENRLRIKTGKSLNDELTNDDLGEATDEIMDLPFASVHQETLHANIDADEYEPFDQGQFQEIMKKTNLLARRRTNYGNTRVALGSRVPMNIAHQIAEFRTGIAYRPKKNTMRNSVPNNIKPLGPLPNNFHEGNSSNNSSNRGSNNGSNNSSNRGSNNGSNNSSNRGSNNGSNSGSNNGVPTANTKCSKGKCAIMGGRRTRKRTYKRRTNRRNTRR
jgi:hypothetical protein